MVALATVFVACNDGQVELTPTLHPTRIIGPTSTPSTDAQVKAQVLSLFQQQVEFIKAGDWEAVYETCSPSFRGARSLNRYVQDATRQFANNGYTPEGFEARNIQPFLRASDRVRVRWDAYQNDRYIRTLEVGQTYIFTQGRWFDDGAWCR